MFVGHGDVCAEETESGQGGNGRAHIFRAHRQRHVAQLDAAGVVAGTPLPERVRMFQLAQGLPPDGVTGPLTLMLLNRSAGVDEPSLAGGR